jgi:hypothetical protein
MRRGSDWPALESNPEVLTGFIHGVGVPETFAFHDVWGLDEEMLSMVPQPAQAVVLLFPDAERSGQTRDAVSEGSSPFFLWFVRFPYPRVPFAGMFFISARGPESHCRSLHVVSIVPLYRTSLSYLTCESGAGKAQR